MEACPGRAMADGLDVTIANPGLDPCPVHRGRARPCSRTTPSMPTPSYLRRASSRAPSRAQSLSYVTSVAGSPSTPRCDAAAIPSCEHWATVRPFRARTAVPYPALAQHTVREARHLACNIKAAVDGRVPSPFTFRPLGTMASLGHTRAVARVFGMRLTGFIAWWVRRTYYLFQMPRWDRHLRIVLDWTVALFFLQDITRVPCAWERSDEADAQVGGEVLGDSSGNAELDCLEPPSASVNALAASTSKGRTAAPA